MSALDATSSVEEVAAAVAAALAASGITAVLSGGAAVQIYSAGLYVSRDLDFISPSATRDIERALFILGYRRGGGRHFIHDSCPYTLEFPPWPLAVGGRQLREWGTHRVGQVPVEILTPTQCVMDRLAAYYFWKDRQGLDQALAVARAHRVDIEQIRRWSDDEGHQFGFGDFQRMLAEGNG